MNSGCLAYQSRSGFLERGKLEMKLASVTVSVGRPQSGSSRRAYVHVSVVVDAVLAGVVAGVDETIVAALFEKPLDGVRVFEVRRTDKFVAWTPKFVPQGRHSAAIFATNSDSGTPAFLAERSTLTPCSSVPVVMTAS